MQGKYWQYLYMYIDSLSCSSMQLFMELVWSLHPREPSLLASLISFSPPPCRPSCHPSGFQSGRPGSPWRCGWPRCWGPRPGGSPRRSGGTPGPASRHSHRPPEHKRLVLSEKRKWHVSQRYTMETCWIIWLTTKYCFKLYTPQHCRVPGDWLLGITFAYRPVAFYTFTWGT